MASKDNKPKRMFMQVSSLPFTENKVNDSGSSNTARITLPYAENVKVDNSDTKKVINIPFAENIKPVERDTITSKTLPYAENIGEKLNGDEVKSNVQFMSIPPIENKAGADFGEPVWKKVEWGGLNLRNTIDSGELSYAKNLSTDEFPYLIPRASRGEYETGIVEPQALFAVENALMWIGNDASDNETLFYDDGSGTVKEFILQTFSNALMVPRSIVAFEDKILIFPDKKYINRDGSGSIGNIGTGTYPADGSCPDIDYACVYGGIGRIFGVKGNEIYANEYGKFNEWTTFEGIESDSWGVKVTSDGDFAGVALYKNHVVAFKPNFTHEQWGTRPPFRIQDIFAVGTIDNRSIKEVNGRLFFCSRDGVYIYTSGEQKHISLKLDKKYVQARAGTDGRKYYLSMYDGSVWDLFVYDTWFDLWTREDDLNVIDFAYWKNYLYALTFDGKILKFNSGTETVEWEAITEYFAGDIINKYVHEIKLRFDIANGSTMAIAIQYDNGSFEEVQSYIGTSNNMQTLKCSITPKQSDRYRIKFSGTGYVKLHAMEVLMSVGGD
ncbi:MAG TPA: hypothetical protein VEF53_18940 [Patescibacteria group bacterium]|nr:hypothetical protein [Patescibacteria group bacterium]